MAYTDFDDTLPVGTATGVQTVTDIRTNLQAMRDAVLMGGFNGWDMAATGGTGEQPTTLTYTDGTQCVKKVLTWHSSGNGDGSVATATYSYSSNCSTYDSIGVLTPTYDTDGNCTATAWT